MKSYTGKRFLVVAGACLLLAGWRIGEAYWWNKQDAAQVRTNAEKAAVLPPVVGDWLGNEVEVSTREKQATGASKITRYRYRLPASDMLIEVTLLVGPTGPIAVHPPTVCLPSAGWRLQADPEVRLLDGDGQRGRFHVGKFVHVDLSTGIRQRATLIWAWNDGRGWDVPVNPRWTYAGRPVLWKIYIGIADSKDDQDLEPRLLEFARLLFETLAL